MLKKKKLILKKHCHIKGRGENSVSVIRLHNFLNEWEIQKNNRLLRKKYCCKRRLEIFKSLKTTCFEKIVGTLLEDYVEKLIEVA